MKKIVAVALALFTVCSAQADSQQADSHWVRLWSSQSCGLTHTWQTYQKTSHTAGPGLSDCAHFVYNFALTETVKINSIPEGYDLKWYRAEATISSDPIAEATTEILTANQNPITFQDIWDAAYDARDAHEIVAKFIPKSYSVTLTKGTGISKIYYKIGTADEYEEYSSKFSAPYGSIIYAYGEASDGYTSLTSESTPASATVTTKGASLKLEATANPCTITIDMGTGISKAYYCIGKPGTYTEYAQSFSAPYGSTVHAYGEASSGYTSQYSKYATLNTTINADNVEIKLTANANTYTVWFDANGGDEPTPISIGVTHGSKYGSLATCTRTGYTLAGWSASTNGGQKVTPTTDVTITSNQTLYAQWNANKYDVTLNLQGGTEGDVAVKATYDAFLPTITAPTRKGYNFCGYFTGSYGAGYQYYDASGVGVRAWDLAQATILYAKWSARVVAISFNQQDGFGGTNLIYVAYDAELPKVPVPTKTGFSFMGYYLGPNSDDQYYNSLGESTRSSCAFSENTTLYAKWGRLYSVKFSYYNALGQETNETSWVLSDEKADPPSLTTVNQRPLYTFTRWNSEEWQRVKQDLNITAEYRQSQYTISFNRAAAGATGEMEDLACTCESEPSFELPSCEFVYTGRDFKGWATNKTGSVVYGDKATVTRNLSMKDDDTVQLYAVWSEKECTIDFNFAPGSNGTERVVATYGKAMPAATMPERLGYTFGGYWAENDQYYTAAGQSARTWDRETNTMLTARWTPNRYTVNFKKSPARVSGTEFSTNLVYDEVFALKNPFTHPDSLVVGIAGWSRNKGVSTPDYSGTNACTLISNVTAVAGASVDLYPVWKTDVGDYSRALNCENLRFISDSSGWSIVTNGTTPKTCVVSKKGKFKIYLETWDFNSISGTLSFDWKAYFQEEDQKVTSLLIQTNGQNCVTLANVEAKEWCHTNLQLSAGVTMLSFSIPTMYYIDDDYIALANVKWMPNRPTSLAFDANGGVGGPQDGVFAATNGAALPSVSPAPTRKGHDFLGYWDAVEGGQQYYTADLTGARNWDKADADVTLYAHWEKQKFTVTVDGQAESFEYGTVVQRTAPIVNVTNDWTNIVCMGWTNGSGDIPTVGTMSTVSFTVTQPSSLTWCYATNYWVHVTAGAGGTVTLVDAAGASLTNELWALEGTNLTATAIPNEGCAFAGWKDAAEEASRVIFVRTPVALEAQFTSRVFQVTFDLAGGTRTGGGALTQSVAWAQAALAPTATRAGYTFVGWDVAFDYITASLTVKAQWELKFFEVSVNGQPSAYVFGSVVTAEVAAVTTDGGTNLVCTGWTNGTGDIPASGTTNAVSFTVTQASSLTWCYATNYWVCVTAGAGGTVALTDAAGAPLTNELWAAVGTNLTATAMANEGHLFAGWNDAVAETSRVISVSAPVALEAQFTSRVFQVTFDLAGGTRTGGGALTQLVAWAQAAVEPTTTRTGYTFAGWNKSFSNITQALVVTAQWTKNPDPEPDPTPTPTPEPEPEPDPEPDPEPEPEPEPTPTPEPVPSVIDEVEGAPAVEKAAAKYAGFIYESAESTDLLGTIEVTAAKGVTNRKTGAYTSKLTIVIQLVDETKKISISGVYDLNSTESQTFANKQGREVTLLLGANGLAGTFEGGVIEGVPRVKSTASYVGSYNLIAEEGIFSVTITKSGTAKLSGKTAAGKSVSVSANLLVGAEAVCVPFLAAKYGLAFTVWLTDEGVRVEGLTEAVIGTAGTLVDDAVFTLDVAELADLMGDETYADYFPNGLSVEQNAKGKWIVAGGAKAGSVTLDKKTGLVNETKAGENPSALKLTYTAKTGAFSGSFKAYANNARGVPKATTFTVTGVLINGVGYGTATNNKLGSLAITIKSE